MLTSCSGNNSSSTKTDEATASTTKSESTTADACTLITEEDAKAILGNAIQKGMTIPAMCQYISGSEELSKAGESVSIQLYRALLMGSILTLRAL